MKSIKKLTLVLACLFSKAIISQTYPYVVPNKDYVVTILTGSGLDARGVASAVDYLSGAVYTCGYVNTASAGKDLILVKFDSTGVQQWVASYNFTSLDDRARALCVDGSGNVYVTGYSEAGSGNKDIVTIKYNSSGTQQWVARYNGTNSTDDEGNSIAFDGGGNIWVCGYSTTTSKGKDFQLLKYNTSGTLLASPKRNGSANADDIAEKLAISGTNLFATGTIKNTTTNGDVVTYCVNTTSVTMTWSTTANGSANGDDTGLDLKLDNGEVFICGKINNTTTGYDYYFARLNQSTGAIKYSNNYDGGYNGTDYATSLVPDAIGNYGVTGIVANGSNTEYHTRLYDTSSVKWTHKQVLNGSYTSINPTIATDTIAQHFYVCGTYSNTSLQAMLYQLTPTGNKSWTEYHDGNTSGKDAFMDLVLDGLGRIYLPLGVETTTANVYDYKLVRYSQTPVYMPFDSLYEEPNHAYLFTENKGQLVIKDISLSDSAISTTPFYTEKSYPTFFIKNNSFSFMFSHFDTIASTTDSVHTVDVTFPDCNTLTTVHPFNNVQGKSSYFIPLQPNGINNVLNYERLMVPEIYPGIDLHYYSNAKGIKVFWVVKPWGNPSSILHKFIGASSTTVNGSGSLIINTTLESLTLEKGYAYQVDTTLSVTSMTWQATWNSLGSDMYSFNIGSYNPMWPLVIEVDEGNASALSPSTTNATWQTYVGGNKDDRMLDMRIDSMGNIYSLMSTNSTIFQTLPSFVSGPISGAPSQQLYKFNKTGTRLNQVFINTSGGMLVSAMTVLPDTTIIIVGNTAGNIPVPTGSLNPAGSFTSSTGTSYIIKLDSTLSQIRWSTHYPGKIWDVDNYYGNIYVVGTADKTGTNAAYFKTQTGSLNLNNSNITGSTCGIITKFNKTGGDIWSSYIPVRPITYGGDPVISISCNKTNGEYYVYGTTSDTTDFKRYNKYNTFLQNGRKSLLDGYIQKYSSIDTLLVSTLYGGNNNEYLSDVVILSNKNVCFVGKTLCSDFSNMTYDPMDGSYYHASVSSPTTSLNYQGWINKFDSTMTRTWAITYGDSTRTTEFRAVTASPGDNIFITGYTAKMPTYSLLSGFYYQTSNTTGDASILHFNSSNQRRWITHYGDNTTNDAGAYCAKYNPVNNNLVWAGENTSATLWPLANFTSPQAYWQPQSKSSNVYTEGFIGRFDLATLSGINEFSNNNKIDTHDFILFPNPTSEMSNLLFKNKINEKVIISVYNMLGQVIETRILSMVEESELVSFNFVNLHDGMYFIKISTKSTTQTLKLIKTR